MRHYPLLGRGNTVSDVVEDLSCFSYVKSKLLWLTGNQRAPGAPDEHGKEGDPAVALEARRRLHLKALAVGKLLPCHTACALEKRCSKTHSKAWQQEVGNACGGIVASSHRLIAARGCCASSCCRTHDLPRHIAALRSPVCKACARRRRAVALGDHSWSTSRQGRSAGNVRCQAQHASSTLCVCQWRLQECKLRARRHTGCAVAPWSAQNSATSCCIHKQTQAVQCGLLWQSALLCFRELSGRSTRQPKRRRCSAVACLLCALAASGRALSACPRKPSGRLAPVQCCARGAIAAPPAS